tara:strand:- start:38203 stop:38796 length:594 start_codon:yes stop_codon:yes gene_type:complete
VTVLDLQKPLKQVVEGKSVTPLNHRELCDVFHECFSDSHQTRVKGGGSEPIYRPKSDTQDHHLIVYSHDYAASALHEIAHWCVAGDQRRQLEDYGYWYAPDGRSREQQIEFEKVEVKPQSFEWMFSVAAGRSFRISADNLEAGVGASESFKEAIYEQVSIYCKQGLPARAECYLQALAQRSGRQSPRSQNHYRREQL